MQNWFGECTSNLAGIFSAFPEGCQIPLREWTNDGLKFLVRNFGHIFDSLSDLMLLVLRQVELSLLAVPWWSVIVVITVISWLASRNRLLAVGLGAALIFIGMVDLWEETMRTLSMLLMATGLTMIMGIPVGILMATNRWIRSLVNPVLDAMQTVPSFVYLVPFIYFFGPENVKM